MKTVTIASRKGMLSRCFLEGSERIGCLSDFLELMVSCPSDTIVLDKDGLAEEFFDLRSGVAGEFLQKVSNYRKRLIVLGDYRDIASKALKDFIYESNRTGKVIFIDDLEGAVELLS